jgi:hypothetical protein
MVNHSTNGEKMRRTAKEIRGLGMDQGDVRSEKIMMISFSPLFERL